MSLPYLRILKPRKSKPSCTFFEVEDEALTARCFCHEIEHLDGHLFVERTDHLLTEEELEEYIQQEEGDDEE